MTSVLQASLTGGELAPSMYGRVDLVRYGISLKTCKNFIVQPYGGIKNRAGLRYLGEAKSHSVTCKLVPFTFSTTQTYILEFGNLYMRVWKDQGQVVHASRTAWATSTAYVAGDEVTQGGSNYRCVTGHTSGTFATDLSGGKWTLMGVVGAIVEVVTPYATADLAELKYTQKADVLTLVHPNHHPRQLSRTDHDEWALSLFANNTGPFQEINTAVASLVTCSAVTGSVTLTCVNPIFTADKVGQQFYMEMMNYPVPWEVNKAIALNDIRRCDGKYYQAENAATTGTLRPTHYEGSWSDGGVTWKYLHQGYGSATITAVGGGGTTATVTVNNRLPDEQLTVGTYKWAFGAWGGDQGYPSVVCYHQQRQVFAATPAQPQTVWTSRKGAYTDFSVSNPLQDDDALTFTLDATQVNGIRGLIPSGKLVALTSASEWAIGADQPLSPSSLGAEVQGYRGSSHLPPIGIGDTVLFCQDKGQVVRDLGYDIARDKFTGTDLTVLAAHLVEGHRITDWAFQQVPFQTVWAVRDDGQFLSITYMKEQEVIGWAPHDTEGEVESVACVSEDDEDAVYFVVKRIVNGSAKRYIERMANRQVLDVRDAFFVDSGLSYDGTNTTATTLTVSGGTLWDHTETLTVTASSAIFSHPATTDLGDALVFEDENGDLYRLTITGLTSTTAASATLNKTLPAAYRNAARTDWAFARNTMTGLSHLEGATVSVLNDGNVEAQKVVASGAISLDVPGVKVHVGLPYESDLETLRLAIQTNETGVGKKKLIPSVQVMVQESRGIKAGSTFANLYEYASRLDERYDHPADLISDVVMVNIDSTWDKSGQFVIRQSDPLPLTVLALVPEVILGGV